LLKNNLFDITVERINYEAFKDVDDNCGKATCAFFNSNCAVIQQENQCYENRIFWVRKEDMKSITQEVKDWNNADVVQEQSPGTKYDQDKLQYSLIPSYALEQIAKNLTVGLKKYKERDNWKKVQGAEQRYLDALYRHLEAHRRGELYDTDSSVPDMLHMAAVAVNAMFLLEFMLDPKLKQKDNK
jgi:hypothetical protein